MTGPWRVRLYGLFRDGEQYATVDEAKQAAETYLADDPALLYADIHDRFGFVYRMWQSKKEEEAK